MPVATLRVVISKEADAELRRLASDSGFRHRDAARHAVRFRATGNVADLVAICDDPHPCGMVEVVFALAGTGTFENFPRGTRDYLAKALERMAICLSNDRNNGFLTSPPALPGLV